MKIGYTLDGKKVEIIQRISENEFLVREIYIGESGKEFKNKKSFIIDTVFDEPVKSWRNTEIEKLEKRIEQLRKQAYNEYNKLYQTRSEVKEKIAYYKYFCSDKVLPALQLIEDILLDNLKYLVAVNNKPTIIKYDKQKLSNYFPFEPEFALPLIKIYGRNDGYLQIQSTQGGYYIPCKTHEEAVEKLKHLLCNKSVLWTCHIKEAEKWNIQLPKDRLKEYYERIKRQCENNIRKNIGNTVESERELSKAKEQLKLLKGWEDLSTYKKGETK